MEKIQKQLNSCNAKWPYTSVMRNYLATTPIYSLRQTEWKQTEQIYACGLQLFQCGEGFSRPKKRLFCVDKVGPKNEILEECFKDLYDWMCENLEVFYTQGPEDAIAEDDRPASKEENVIITGPEETTAVEMVVSKQNSLLDWSNTEKYYEFSDGMGAVMNRWFPLDTVKITTALTPQVNGGLVKAWKIPEDLIKTDLNAANVLPLRIFTLGKLDLEFKMVLQANPFQACCVMMGTMPNPYALFPQVKSWSGVRAEDLAANFPYSFESQKNFSYADRDVAVQRPNTIVDVRTGGQGTLRVHQKYHKTLIRNFDASYVTDMNVGIRGSWSSNLTLHVITPLRIGTGSDQDFTIRIFYRFVEAKLAGMSEAIKEVSTGLTLATQKTVPVDKFTVQGPVMSIVKTTRGVVDIADQTLSMVEDIGTIGRKGFRGLNRDKPNDPAMTMKVVPRPRSCFNHGVGIDDAIVMAMSWDELVEFFDTFDGEPTNFKEFMDIKGILTVFKWSRADAVGASLFDWRVHPTIAEETDDSATSGNNLRTPLAIASSAFTNYWGTIELCFQFVKTDFHKGAVQVSVQFGKRIVGDALRSTYVKVLNIQDCSAFKLTVPYIYDTPVRTIAGTTTPLYIPNVTNQHVLKFASSTIVNVQILNELTCPDTVTSEIDVVVWMKGGSDYHVNFPHPMNTATFITSGTQKLLFGGTNVRSVMSAPKHVPQFGYDPAVGNVVQIPTTTTYVTQGDDEDDFNSGALVENRITTRGHGDFSDILKIPIKILRKFEYSAKTTLNYIGAAGVKVNYEVQNYFTLPVAPLSYSLVDYLNHEWYNSKSTVLNSATGLKGNTTLQQSLQCQINSMFGMYRGGLVYTIVVTSGTKPVYCCYLPHDYDMRPLVGPLTIIPPLFYQDKKTKNARQGIIGMIEDSSVDLSQAFPGTIMIIPSVNPTEKVIIPMSTQSNWLLMNRKLANMEKEKVGFITLRENEEWFNGHLCLWSDANFEFDLFLNASDDHKIGGFLGHHGIVNPWAQFALEDSWRTQGPDFNFKEITSSGWSSVKRLSGMLSGGVTASVISSLVPDPVKPIMVGAAAFCAIGGINETLKLKNLLTDVGQTVSEVESALASNTIVEDSARIIIGIVKECFPLAVMEPSFVDNLWAAAQHIVHSSLSSNWKNAAFGVFCMIVKMDLFSMSDWKTLADPFINYFSTATPSSAGTYETQGDEDSSPWMAMCDVIVAILGGKMQVSCTGGVRDYLKDMFKYQNYRNVAGLNSVMMLVRRVLSAVGQIFSWLLQKKDPNIVLIQSLHKQGSEIATFVDEASKYLNHFNDKDIKRKADRVRYLGVILQAYKLREVLLHIGNPRLSQQLLNLCAEVIRKAQRQRYLFQCDVVKSEPFVLCVSGASNLGKSFSVYDLASEGLKKIGIIPEVPDYIFTIPAGVDYWNGYEDQPVIWYDDWCNIRDDATIKQHISQLYALKTSAPFNVPRAELENKEQVANPNLIIMTTNNAFPSHPIISYPEAVWRRRDLLVEFVLKDGKESIKDFTKEQLDKFEHLDVYLYSDPKKPGSRDERKLTYAQFKEVYLEALMAFHLQELKNKEKKYSTLMKNVSKSSLDSVDLGNPFEMIHKLNKEELISKPTAELIETEVFKLKELIENHLDVLKIQVGDDELFEVEQDLFEAQGPFGEVHGTLNEPILFKTQAPFKETEKEAYEKSCEGLYGKFKHYFQQIKRVAMVCDRCGLEASSQGTAFWCQEHNHYLCFHCGVQKARPYGIERESNQVYLDVSCPMHATNLVVHKRGWVLGCLGSILNLLVYQPIFMLTMLYRKFDSTEEVVFLSQLFILKVMLMKLISICSGKIIHVAFALQGNTPEEAENEPTIDEIEPIFRGPVGVLGYNITDRWVFQPEFSIACKEKYLQFVDNIGGTSKETIKAFICPHSLLSHQYIYNNGKFHVGLSDFEDMIELEDKFCKGKCVLTNLRYLQRVRSNFLVSFENLRQYKLGNIDVIAKEFPKFARTAEIQEAIKRREWINRIIRKDWWENYIFPAATGAWAFIKKVIPFVAISAALWIANKGFNKLWKWICSLLGIEAQGLISSGATPTKSRKGTRQKRSNTYQSQSSSENFDNKISKICKNFVVLMVNGRKLLAWGIKNTTLLIPKHLGKYVKSCNQFTLKFLSDVKREITYYASDCDFVEIEDKDLMQIDIKTSAPLFKDCTNFIPPGIGEFSHTKGVMLVVDLNDMAIYEQETRIINVSNNFEAMDGKDTIYSRQVVMYDVQAKGMCGSLLCVDSNTPIMAMHVAGSEVTGRGVGVPLNIKEYVVQGGVCELLDTGENTVFYGEDCLIEYEASVALDMVPYIPKKTTIMPSLIAKFLDPPLTMPAFLNKSEGYLWEYSPLYYGVRKNGFPSISFPTSYVDSAFSNLKKLLLKGDLIRTPSILTIKEAVCGLPTLVVDDKYNMDDEDAIYYGSLPLDTSAGFPYSTSRIRKQFNIKKMNKEEWISIEYDDGLPVDCVIHPFVLQNHDTNMELRRSGIMSENIFQDCLKDERRPIAKAMAQGGTRLFSMSNIEGSIALRRYTLDLTSFLRYNRIKNGIAVGINPDSLEWTILAQTLLKHPNIFTTDFVNFGAGLDYKCGMKFANLAYEFLIKFSGDLPAHEQKVIHTLIRELLASRHIAGNLIYGTFCGSPSGAAITVEINSFVHLMYILIVWLIVSDVINRECGCDSSHYPNLVWEYKDLVEYLKELKVNLRKFVGKMTLDDFNHNVVRIVYGDDGIFSVSDEYRDIFNAKVINLVLKDHGIGVTDSSKQSEIVPYGSILDVTFLKRSFVPHELLPKSLYMAKMCDSTVEECAKWIHKNELGPEVSTIENCRSALMLAFGHGEEYYEAYRERLNEHLCKIGLEEVQITWRDLCLKFYPDLTISV